MLLSLMLVLAAEPAPGPSSASAPSVPSAQRTASLRAGPIIGASLFFTSFAAVLITSVPLISYGGLALLLDLIPIAGPAGVGGAVLGSNVSNPELRGLATALVLEAGGQALGLAIWLLEVLRAPPGEPSASTTPEVSVRVVPGAPRTLAGATLAVQF